MTVKEEATIILKDVGKGLGSIIFPPPQKDETKSEYINLHYCEKCKKYHKAE
jgi:hypothetical protein